MIVINDLLMILSYRYDKKKFEGAVTYCLEKGGDENRCWLKKYIFGSVVFSLDYDKNSTKCEEKEYATGKEEKENTANIIEEEDSKSNNDENKKKSGDFGDSDEWLLYNDVYTETVKDILDIQSAFIKEKIKSWNRLLDYESQRFFRYSLQVI